MKQRTKPPALMGAASMARVSDTLHMMTEGAYRRLLAHAFPGLVGCTREQVVRAIRREGMTLDQALAIRATVQGYEWLHESAGQGVA